MYLVIIDCLSLNTVEHYSLVPCDLSSMVSAHHRTLQSCLRGQIYFCQISKFCYSTLFRGYNKYLIRIQSHYSNIEERLDA